MTRVLVACIGNVFLGDDGFGVAVAKHLAGRKWPHDVRVVDFGIRGFDLTFALLEGYDAAILVDVAQRGGAPGTLYVIEPVIDPDVRPDPRGAVLDMHAMDPVKVLALVRAMGGELKCLRVVGCEPATFGDGDDIAVGLSPEVLAAIEPAAALVESLVAGLTQGELAHA